MIIHLTIEVPDLSERECAELLDDINDTVALYCGDDEFNIRVDVE